VREHALRPNEGPPDPVGLRRLAFVACSVGSKETCYDARVRRVLSSLTFLLACNAPAPAEPAVPVDLPPVEAPPVDAPRVEAPGANAAGGADDPLQPLRAVDTPESRAAIERLQGLARLLEDTKNAARDAAAAQSDPCRQAFASNVAAQRVSAEIAARHEIPIPRWELLSEADYLAACADLSPELVACARYDRRIEERERCDGVERDADEAQRARYRTLVPPRR
jgi:hypothetical protein